MEIKDLNSELELKRESEIIPETEKAPSAQKDMSPKEILTKRGLCSKTFQKGKGVFETKYYRTPIHLYDAESNSFVEAEKRVVETEDKQSYQNDQHDFKINFYKENAEKALYSVSKEEKKITAIVKSPFGESVNRLAPEPMKKDTELNYPEVIPDTDYRCSVVPCGIKTSILIRKADPNRRYGFCFAFDGFLCKKAGNSLLFFSAEDETPAFAVSAPYMTDASGRYSERVSLVPFEEENGKINVDIVPEAGWLNEKEREYPIRVEWTLREIVTDIPQIAFEESLISADGKLEVGGSAVPFRMVLPKRNEGMIRKKTELLVQCENVPVADGREFLLALDRVIVDPETGEPQTKRLTIVPLAALQTEYAFDVTSEETVAENASYSLQLCEMADGVLNRGVDSPAVLLNVSPMSEAALFSVTETDGTSEQDGTSGGESGNLGSVATYEVDIVSGLLNMEMKDFAWEGNRMPVSISHSFRGQYANNPYLWGHTGTNPFSNMQIGLGWRLNLMQCMIHTGVCSDHNQSYWLKDTYTYIDESGEGLIFAQCECESGSSTCTTYEDVNGLGYTYNAATGILKKGKEEYRFTNSRLTKITNEYNNSMNIVYDAGGKINCVTDGVNRAFSFQYDGNNLIAIAAPNNAAVSFSYCSNRLCCASFPNGQTMSFDYHGNGLPSTITVGGTNIASIVTHFDLNRDGKIVSIYADGSNRSVAFDYRNGKQTVITDCEEQDGDQCPRIKHYRVFLHEHSDKNYSYYESDNESKIEVSGTHGIVVPYTEPGMEIGNLKCQNLLANHNFDTTIGDLKASHPVGAWRTNLRDNFVQFDPPEKMPGRCAAYLINWAKQYTDDGIWQNVTLESGKSYVFSCYLKLARANGSNKGVYLKVRSNNGGSEFISQKITVRKEFQRVALPFHVGSGCGTSFSVGIYIDDYVQAKAIAPQLEEGTYLSPYNYLKTQTVTINGNGPTCSNAQTVATVYVPTGKDAKETFTLSGYVRGGMLTDTNAYVQATINYFQTSQERRENIYPSSNFSLPIYSVSGEQTFFMLQFSKSRYRSIENIQIACGNDGNSNPLTFSNLQLVRNSYADGLSEEDFAGATETEDASDDPETIDRVTDAAEEVETIVFEEVKDGHGNALTSTNFQNGEFGTIYGESKFDDTNQENPLQDEGNNKTEEIDARGNSTHYEYDPVTSKPTAVIDRCENRTEYTYDASGRTTQVKAANNGTVNYAYNGYDDLTGITRGDGQAYNMAYDPFRNLTGVQVGNQSLVSYAYKAGTNRLKAVTYANGSVQTLTYDRFGNVVTEVWMQGNIKQAEYRYSYDASRNLVKTVDILGRKMYNINRSGENIASVEEYHIDWNGSAAVDPVLVGTMLYSFDSNGKQFRKKYIPADGSQEQKYVFEFKDEQNVAVKLPTGAVSHAKSDHFGRKVFDEIQLGKGFLNRTFTYHKGVVSEKHEEENKRVSDPTTTLVKEIKFANGRTIVYEYDNEERITKVVDSEDGTRRYEYDSLGQLTKEERLTGTYFAPELCEEIDEYTTVNEMTYDLYGNITEKNGVPYTYGNSTWKDLLTGVGNQTISYDANGNPTNYLGHTLAWEKGRQLKAFDGNTYRYNNDGIRIEKVENCKTHKYILDGTNILKEIVEDTCCNCTGYTNEYLYDLDGTVCGIKHNGTAYYFYKNLQGDVIAITDETGAIVAKYSYDAWGKCKVESDTSGVDIANINPFRYRSYYYDSEIGMYYLQSRYYDPEVGRFINADDVETLNVSNGAFSCNLFVYCHNDPTSNADYNGKWLERVICGIAAAALFATLAFVTCKIVGIFVHVSGKITAIVTAACGVLGGIIGAVLGPSFLAKHAPNLLRAIKAIEKKKFSIKAIGPNTGGNIFGIVISNTLIIMLHAPHPKYNEWYFHLQVEVKLGGKQFPIWKFPIISVNPSTWRKK